MKLRQRRWTVTRLDGIVTGRLKCRAEHQANTWLVVDDQDQRGGVHGLPLFKLPRSFISERQPRASSVPDTGVRSKTHASRRLRRYRWTIRRHRSLSMSCVLHRAMGSLHDGKEPSCNSSAVVRFRASTSAAVAVSSQLVLEGLREQLGSSDSPFLRKGGYTLLRK